MATKKNTGSTSATSSGIQADDPSGLPADFKDNKVAQFEYGRRTERATHHFDTTSRRLETGNPDVGEVDLGTIQADQPAQPDDNDHYDSTSDPDLSRGIGSESDRSDV